MKKYELWVSNIGRVHYGNYKGRALKIFDDYVAQSRKPFGRASGEEVTLFEDGEIIAEYYNRPTCLNCEHTICEFHGNKEVKTCVWPRHEGERG